MNNNELTQNNAIKIKFKIIIIIIIHVPEYLVHIRSQKILLLPAVGSGRHDGQLILVVKQDALTATFGWVGKLEYQSPSSPGQGYVCNVTVPSMVGFQVAAVDAWSSGVVDVVVVDLRGIVLGAVLDERAVLLLVGTRQSSRQAIGESVRRRNIFRMYQFSRSFLLPRLDERVCQRFRSHCRIPVVELVV